MTKRTVAQLFCAAILAICIAAILSQRNAFSVLRENNTKLLEQKTEFEKLFKENSHLPELREQNDLVQQLRRENQDLYKLRNEIGHLRNDKVDLDKIRSENARLSALPAQAVTSTSSNRVHYVTKDALQNLGYATPEDALQTVFWAALKGTPQDIKESMFTGKDLSDEESQNMKKQAMEEMQSFRTFAIAEKIVYKDEVVLKVQGRDHGGKLPLTFRKTANGWKFAPH